MMVMVVVGLKESAAVDGSISGELEPTDGAGSRRLERASRCGLALPLAQVGAPSRGRPLALSSGARRQPQNEA